MFGTHDTLPKQPRVQNIVFDMGGVLMTFDGFAFAQAFTDTQDDAVLLYNALFNRPEWSLVDAGAIDHATMERIAQAQIPERLLPNLEACCAGWPALSQPIVATNDLALRLKKAGYGVYLLSNASTHIENQLDHMPARRVLDGCVVSAFERLMKPDPIIFELLCDRYELDPATCLFIDDNLDNCQGAEIAGMHSFHFTGNADALEAAITAISSTDKVAALQAEREKQFADDKTETPDKA